MKRPPFIVYSLPRSRSAWTARFLSYGGETCGHDLATRCSKVAELAGMLTGPYAGTAETGAVLGWRALRRVLPDAKIAVIRRPVAEVYASLARFGLGSPALMDELNGKDALLEQVSGLPGVVSVQFSEMERLPACQSLFEHCLGVPFDWEWWEHMALRNVQIDMPERLRHLAASAGRIEALKRDAARVCGQNQVIKIGPEPWDSLWPEIDSLFAEHFAEVEGDLAERRPYRLDEPAMRMMCEVGVMQIVSARVDGVLAGYCMWQVTKDVESAGLLIAQHGPWFVRAAYAHLLLGQKLFDASVAELRRLGVSVAFPHHRMRGRGVKLGAFFRRRGAVETQRTYSMWLGEARHG